MKEEELNELLNAEEPEDKIEVKRKKFEPKFNVREEFALWVREQFPDLRKQSKKKREYIDLESRRGEIYEAALGAVNQGVLSTEACAKSQLRYGWEKLEEGFKEDADPKGRAKSLEAFVSSLETLSTSLGGNKHFTQKGTLLRGSSYGSLTYNDHNAFIYRVDKEDSNETTYLVFEEIQGFEEDNQPVLIGEFTQLTKWNLDQLEKITSEFKGPELEFIEEVDRLVPETGVYVSQRPTQIGSTTWGKDEW